MIKGQEIGSIGWAENFPRTNFYQFRWFWGQSIKLIFFGWVGRPWTDIKSVGCPIFQHSVPFPTWTQDLTENFRMSNINASRLPLTGFLVIGISFAESPYTGDNDDNTLTRGQEWVQHPTMYQMYLYACISLCWALNNWSASSLLLCHEGACHPTSQYKAIVTVTDLY